jgi:hypothetical protein
MAQEFSEFAQNCETRQMPDRQPEFAGLKLNCAELLSPATP